MRVSLLKEWNSIKPYFSNSLLKSREKNLTSTKAWVLQESFIYENVSMCQDHHKSCRLHSFSLSFMQKSFHFTVMMSSLNIQLPTPLGQRSVQATLASVEKMLQKHEGIFTSWVTLILSCSNFFTLNHLITPPRKTSLKNTQQSTFQTFKHCSTQPITAKDGSLSWLITVGGDQLSHKVHFHLKNKIVFI